MPEFCHRLMAKLDQIKAALWFIIVASRTRECQNTFTLGRDTGLKSFPFCLSTHYQLRWICRFLKANLRIQSSQNIYHVLKLKLPSHVFWDSLYLVQGSQTQIYQRAIFLRINAPRAAVYRVKTIGPQFIIEVLKIS